MSARLLALAALALVTACASPQAARIADAAPAQRAWTASCEDFDDWNKAGPPFRVYGNTYYVGTCGISSLLITSKAGHALIDSGTEKGAEIVLANIRALGFDPRDVKVLLMSHEHFDHVGGMARLQAATGAPIMTTADAAAVLRTGVPAQEDPQHDASHPPFAPITGPIDELRAYAPVRAGSIQLWPLRTPGHTSGALSWSWRECEAGECRTIVYADSLSPVSSDGFRFSDHPALVADFRASAAKLAEAPCDIVLAPHPSSAAMRDKAAGTKPLADPDSCRAYAASVNARLDKRLAEEANGG